MWIKDTKVKLIFTKSTRGILPLAVKFNDLSPREKELVKLYQTNLTLAEIAKQIGIGQTTLHNIIRKIGLNRARQFKYKGYNKKKISELMKLGASDRVISEKLDISVSTLRRIKKRLGLWKLSQREIEAVNKRKTVKDYNRKNGILPECPNKTNILERYYDKVLELLKSGMPKAEIARYFNVCPGTVFNFINLYGLDVPQVKKCDLNEKVILDCYKNNISLDKIARTVHCSITTLNLKLKEMGLERDKNAVKRESLLNSQEDLIRKLYEQGLTGDEIAKHIHAHPVSVYNKIQKMGLTRSHKWADYRSKQSRYDEKIVKLRNLGKTYKEIGDLLDIPYTTVSYRYKRLEGANA